MKHLGFDFEYGAQEHAAPGDAWQATAHGYRVTFTYDRRTMSTDYWMGSALTDDPEAHEVMACLVGDAQLGRESFHDFCADLGYDEDSRKAEATWKACQKIDNQLQRLFGHDYDAAMSRDWEQVEV